MTRALEGSIAKLVIVRLFLKTIISPIGAFVFVMFLFIIVESLEPQEVAIRAGATEFPVLDGCTNRNCNRIPFH